MSSKKTNSVIFIFKKEPVTGLWWGLTDYYEFRLHSDALQASEINAIQIPGKVNLF